MLHLIKKSMGCVNSRTDINDLHPNIFQVMNVDDLGNLITPGRLEVTETDIVLYQRGRQPVKWPLRCLRRYGYDSEIFSFESGRRCSTGPGIYAFKCRRADQLFNLVQTNIQVCNNGDDAISRDLSIPSHSGPTITRTTIPNEPNYLDPTPLRPNGRVNPRFSHSQQNGVGRLGSVGSSSGPISPQGTMSSPSPPPMMLPPPPPVPQPHPSALYVNDDVLSSMALELEHNNNKSLRRMQRSCTVSSTTSSSGFTSDTIGILNQEVHNHNRPPPLPMASYMNVDLSNDVSPLSPSHSTCISTALKEDTSETDNSRHAYMNINPSQENIIECSNNQRTRLPALPILPPSLPIDWDDNNSRHCYANLEPKEIDNLRNKFTGVSVSSNDKLTTVPSTPPVEAIREVNYAVLDLDQNSISTSVSDNTGVTGMGSSANTPATNAVPSPPESPNKPQKGYATIDFNKTAALSHSVNPNGVNDNEGSRKTRHNSTINDLATPSRQSSSIRLSYNIKLTFKFLDEPDVATDGV
ncbi:fibroblast growth factor receptor substrate 2 isoform X2 [Microplitis demolitor]|uniref:fibroblast growth factor receptor substrate 2 isoform X2 n=1 Tax=Microplitis demolitor TaxID=69319 RepID=UPI0006D4F4A7|nr:fibroblast growth factor receptor substrate 2 isoform X2 [Microplitis demolitor]